MKVAFDTSVIVAGSIARHIHEARAAAWFAGAREGTLVAGASPHALAETWATLTGLPVEPRIAPALAGRLLERLSAHVTVVDLSRDTYDRAIRRCSD